MGTLSENPAWLDKQPQWYQDAIARNKAEAEAKAKPAKSKTKTPTTPEKLIAEMHKLAEEAQAEIEGISSLLKEEAQAQQRAAILDELQTGVDDLRAEAMGAIDATRKQADVAFYQAVQQAGPQGAEGWAEAAARAQFVRAELATLAPADVVAQYELAKAAGDELGAWVIGTEGLSHLDKVSSETADVGDQVDAREASYALNQALYGDAFLERQSALAELQNQQLELSRPVTPREQADYRESIGDAFGVDTSLVPVGDGDG